LQLPHVTPSICDQLESKGIGSIRELLALPTARIDQVTQQLFSTRQHRVDFLQELRNLPQLNATLILSSITPPSQFEPIQNSPRHYVVNPRAQLRIEVTLSSLRKISKDIKLYTPRYHKPKTLSWWIVIGSVAGELLALKRLGTFSESNASHSLLFTVPDEVDENGYIVFIIPDSIFGIEILSNFNLTLRSASP
jgi:hypothetical protein